MNYIEIKNSDMAVLERVISKDKNHRYNTRGGLSVYVENKTLTLFTSDGHACCKIQRNTQDYDSELLAALDKKIIIVPKYTKNKRYRLFQDRWEIQTLTLSTERVIKTISESIEFIEYSVMNLEAIQDLYDKVEEAHREEVVEIRLDTALLPKDKIVTIQFRKDLYDKDGDGKAVAIKEISGSHYSEPFDGEFILMPCRFEKKE